MLPWIRRWTDVRRTPQTNLKLGAVLAFVAGAANAGGFLAVGRYTSHMTGIVSEMADHLALGQAFLALGGLASLLSFLAGAMSTAILVNWGRRMRLRSQYALPLMLEAVLLLLFGLLGSSIEMRTALLLPATVLLLCYMMGLQNAVITKISRAEIRTTHVTGLVTDLGIELGKLIYVNRHPGEARVLADRARLRVHALLIGMFFVGGLVGALGFAHVGYATTIALAALLAPISVQPFVDDLRIRSRVIRRRSARPR